MTLSTRLKRLAGCVLCVLISAVSQCSSNSPPGKPALEQCHSRDKETFTCRWEPDANDGADTIYHLFYEKERSSKIFECPDYHTGGKNSCFFDKNHTSIWVYYYLTVVAVNVFGNTTSDVLKIDVVDIVIPNPPENVTLRLELIDDIPTVHVTWNSYNIDKKSGWITPKYELRFKNEDTPWKLKHAGVQTQFSLYSVSLGKSYMVQVHGRFDNGAWSEWSDTAFIEIPKFESTQKQIWIVVSFLSVLPVLAAVYIMFIKRKIVKQWLLPPVPGPKIKGVDVQLLKNGRTEEVTSALLINHVFPSVMPWKNQAEEFLVVCDDNMLLIEDQTHISGKMISNFHLASNLTDDFSPYSNMKFKEALTISDYLVDPTSSDLIKELNYVNTKVTENALSPEKVGVINVKPVNSSYVDIQSQEVEIRSTDCSTVREHILLPEKPNGSNKDTMRHEERLPEDYTRVKEVNRGNMVLLQDPSSNNNSQYTDCSNLIPFLPETVKIGQCVDSLTNDYVDNNAVIM